MIISGRAWRHNTDKLIFGPYERLPITGRYIAKFNLLFHVPDVYSEHEVVRIDVYGADRVLHERRFTGKEVAPTYQQYPIEFECPDIDEKIEYRVSILRSGVRAQVYDITVAWLGHAITEG
jgi:hypothetical protein